MRRHILKQIGRIVDAKNKLGKDILEEIDFIARQYGFDEITFTHMGDVYRKNGEVIDEFEYTCLAINDLVDAYVTFVHNGGFEGVWTKQKGWC